MAQLVADHGSVVVVHGPRGVGKARLAVALKTEATRRGDAAVLEARCPSAGARSFHPFSDLARQAMVWAEERGLTETLVDPIYPELSAVIDHAVSDRSSTETPSLDQKLAFFEAFRQLLTGVGREGRLCVIIHDVERADADTLEMAAFLADELFGDAALTGRPVRGVLVLLARDDVPGRIEDFVAEMNDRPSARTMGLRGLDLDGLRRYVQSPHVLEKLLEASAGLPQEVDALIDALPSNVEELFERRLESLDALPRELLLAMSVSDRPASARLLAEIVRHPMKEAALALNGLRSDRILTRRIQSGEFQFSFNRRRDQEVAQRALSPEDRAHLHGSWARALSQEHETGGPALLAYHQLRSSEPQRGVPLAVQAAETHAVAGAIHAALEILEDARPHATGELKLTILARLAELAPLTGNPRRALRLVEEWKTSLAEDQRAPALRREGELHNAAGDYHRALEALAGARLLFEAAPDQLNLARVDATASEAHYHLAETQLARECCEAGLERLATARRDEATPRLRLDLLNQLGKIALAEGDAERAVKFFEETLDVAGQQALLPEEARSLVNIGIVQLRQGELDAARESLEAGIERSRSANDLSRLAFGYMSIGALHHQIGSLGEAITAYRECRSLFRRLGNRTQLARVMNNLGNLHQQCGDLERARIYNDEALRLAQLSGVERVEAVATVVDGVIFAEQNQPEAAEARLREGMLLHQRHGSDDRALEALIELTELHFRAGTQSRARAALDEAQKALRDVQSGVLEARVDLLAGQLAERPEEAFARLEACRDRFASLGRRLLERDAEVALAEALLGAGRAEMARVRLAAADRIQSEVAEGLPDELRTSFGSAAPQKRIEAVHARLDGRSVPSARPVEDARAVTLAAPKAPPVPARKPEWSDRYGPIIGQSARLLRVFHILDRVTASDGTVLIVGESGTGKELVAEAIHRNSPRAAGPFVKLNCAALVESLLLSELFGHERGSFTGAHQRKIGRFEMAAGGTLFLDEIGDISPKTQVALLRVLQEREFERVGGGQTLNLDARIVFATNRNLAQMVRDGTFREDLYYRLKGITIDLPPLRDRPDDIVTLAEHFLEEFARESDSPTKRLGPEAAQLIGRYPWPGNIRELENIIRSVALFAEGEVVTSRDFDEYRELFQEGPLAEITGPSAPAPLVSAPAVAAAFPAPEPSEVVPVVPVQPEPDPTGGDLLGKIFQDGIPLPELKKQIQTEAIARALRMTEGNITRAAEILGMRRPRLSQIINADDALKRLAQGASR